MTPELHAHALRQEAEAHARQRVPIAELTHAKVLDVALSIVSDNLARALADLKAARDSAPLSGADEMMDSR